MKVSYDQKYDIAYIYIAGQVKYAGTHSLDFDIHLDLDPDGRLLGIEILDATRRLDLAYPFMVTRDDKIPTGWPQLREELRRRMGVGLPIITESKHAKNWITDVGDDYVVLRPDKSESSQDCKIKASDLENDDLDHHRKNADADIIKTLWLLGQYPVAFRHK